MRYQSSKEITFLAGASVSWATQPAGVTELITNTGRRRSVDLSGYVQWRLHVGVATVGAAGAALGVQYSTDGGATWKALDTDTTNAQAVGKRLIDALGSVVGAWSPIHPNALKGDLLLRIVGDNGDGAASPAFIEIIMEVRD